MSGNDILHASSISPQVLVSQQIGTTDTAVYTVPSGQSVKVAHGTLCNVTANIAAPTLTLGTTATSGGTFTAGTYYWKVVASNANGTIVSNEVTATLAANGTQALSWTAVPGATNYTVYRGTSAGRENVALVNQAITSYTDTGAAGTASPALPTASTYSAPAQVWLSIVKTGVTLGDGTHRVMNSYTLNANDTLSLHDYIAGAMLGPGDQIAAYASIGTAVDLVITGTVHA